MVFVDDLTKVLQLLIAGIACRVGGTGSMNRYVRPFVLFSVRLSVHPSVLAWARSSKPATAGMLLAAWWAGDIDCCSSGGRMRAVPRYQRT